MQSRRLRPVARPLIQGDHVIVFAVDRQHHIHRVTIDRNTGQILQIATARADVAAATAQPPDDGSAEVSRSGAATNPARPNPRSPATPPMEEGESWAPPPDPETEPKPAAPAAADVPMPRPRPGDAPRRAGTPNAEPNRVVLPGGPVPKQQRTVGRAYAPAPIPPANAANPSSR